MRHHDNNWNSIPFKFIIIMSNRRVRGHYFFIMTFVTVVITVYSGHISNLNDVIKLIIQQKAGRFGLKISVNARATCNFNNSDCRWNAFAWFLYRTAANLDDLDQSANYLYINMEAMLMTPPVLVLLTASIINVIPRSP